MKETGSNAIDLESVDIHSLVDEGFWTKLTGENPTETIFYVVVPAHNEEKIIRECILCLTKQTIPVNSKLQVHVVSNGSNDGTKDVVRQVHAEVERSITLDKNIKLELSQLEIGNKPLALNIGRGCAPTDIVIHVDADARPTADSVARIYALMRMDPDCMVASVLPKRSTSATNGILQHVQDYYDTLTRINGAVIGKMLAYRPASFTEFPLDTGSEDTWLEYIAIRDYGVDSIGFLGQNPESTTVVYYVGAATFYEYLGQLVRWESEFRKLLHSHSWFRQSCRIAARVKQPRGLKETLRYAREENKEFSFFDKLITHALLYSIRKFVAIDGMAKIFGKGGGWNPPQSDRK